MAIVVGFIYLAFLAALLYAVLFVGDLGAPRMIDLGPATPALLAWVTDGTLLALFALLHAAWMHEPSSAPGGRGGAGRSGHAYALIAGLTLTAFFIAWRPLPQIIWSLSGTPASILRVLFYLGWTLVLISALICHARPFAVPGAVGARRACAVAEPLYPGSILALWAAPTMTAGHLLLTGFATAYVLASALLEGRGSSGIARVSSPLIAGFASERGGSRPERR
jgi:methanethiol S-methyltransferase